MSQFSDQEIDLRPYIEAILGKWYWILGLGVLAGIVAYVLTSITITPTYQATALVSIVEPIQRVTLDPRIVTVEDTQPLKAFPEIAVSDELLTTLQKEVPETASYSLPQLRSMLNADLANSSDLLKLTAKNENPETATAIANGWAELFISWANSTYGGSNDERLLFFEQRLEEAAAELEVAEQSLVNYQAENRSLILDNQLQALQKAHAGLLSKEAEIDLLFQDIESLLALSQTNSTNRSTSTASEQFAALMLSLRAFGGPPGDTGTTYPWQLQVNADTFSSENTADQVEKIKDLQASLEIQEEQIKAALAEIEPQILAVQKEKQEANATEALLQRNVEIAEEAHTALALTVEEKRITSQDTNSGVSLTSRSAVPTSPLGPRKMTTALAARLGTIFFSILLIILITWWRTD